MSSWKIYHVPVQITQVLTYEVKARSQQEAMDKVENSSSSLDDPISDETMYVEVDYHKITEVGRHER